ncbi:MULTISPECIES: circadian clock protein KaiC [unclassified Methylobacterium]|uniref:circadian clock protein KaiC n=1 Tax=unclassified Methylobacterium TaxID=2615210 RepID=UPI001FBA1B6E|nr:MULTISPECIES: circadian clock protein KaiC [unclassified Methylobacterium]MCJ2092071.1 circadian clock protein KaiC [Methylobacterium sp. J-072]MCJ2139749.1 circadian clock protein KaiC [Methylobacterium sp. E-066]
MTSEHTTASLPKARTGIDGFDDVTFGGLPTGRPSLVCGAAGCGKTLFATTFLVNGATLYDEPGVFMSFEERAEDLSANVASLGYDLDGLMAAGKIAVDHVKVERSEIEETGEYDLEGLFIRLGYAVDTIKAKRVVLDTIETLFAGLSDAAVLRSELRRLFGWLKDRGLTAIITGERGEGQLTRQGLEEYVSDCVVLLDNRVEDQITTRRLRIVKYRGSAHGTNEYPFLIDEQGISVLPVTAADLSYKVSNEIVSTGVESLDAMFGSGGLFRGSSVLISGSAGTGKTTISSHTIDAACARGEHCMSFVFEESGEQICRNAHSVGLDLRRHLDAGLLRFEAARPSLYGLEMHLARMHRDIEQFRPSVVVIDPISALRGPEVELQATLLRMVDMLKARGITAVFTSLRTDGAFGQSDDLGLSSLMDVWIKLQDIEANGERSRTLYVIKARGMSHSNQVREFQMSAAGLKLVDAYIGPAGVLTGTARIVQEAQEEAAALRRQQDSERRKRDVTRRRQSIERQIAELRDSLETAEEEETLLLDEDTQRETMLTIKRTDIARRRSAAE